MRFSKKISVFLLLLAVIAVFTACSSSNGGSRSLESADKADGGQSVYAETSSVETRKIIYTASLSLEAGDIPAAVRFVKGKLSDGEWSANEEISSYNTYLTLRIKTARLDEFIDSLEEGGTIHNFIKRSTDVSLDYYDKQGRLDTLAAERAILLELLAKASNISEQMQISARLAEIQREKDSLQTALNHYDNEIEYSTVTVYFTQKYIPEEDPTYGEQLGGAFSGGWYAFGQVFKYIFIALTAAFPFLLTGAVITLSILFGRKFYLKRKKRPQTNTFKPYDGNAKTPPQTRPFAPGIKPAAKQAPAPADKQEEEKP